MRDRLLYKADFESPSRREESWKLEKFNSYKNKLDILRNCKKLKGTNFSIFEDFSKETASLRKEKWKEVLKNRNYAYVAGSSFRCFKS